MAVLGAQGWGIARDLPGSVDRESAADVAAEGAQVTEGPRRILEGVRVSHPQRKLGRGGLAGDPAARVDRVRRAVVAAQRAQIRHRVNGRLGESRSRQRERGDGKRPAGKSAKPGRPMTRSGWRPHPGVATTHSGEAAQGESGGGEQRAHPRLRDHRGGGAELGDDPVSVNDRGGGRRGVAQRHRPGNRVVVV